jgi:alkyl hydroperoxide reductase subunit F
LITDNEYGEIVIGPDCSTSAPGICAAGDVTNADGKRVIIATGEGAKAALSVHHYLLQQA